MSDVMAAVVAPDEVEFEATLRPSMLAEFVGQEQVKRQVGLIIEAARNRGAPPDHLLFSGPPGLGKTSLAHIVANEVGVPLRPTSGPSLERAGDLAAIVTNLEPGEVLFIDEIHRLPRPVEEVLYQAMEDFKLDVVIGKGPSARSIRIDLPPFTLIGATTRTGLLTGPLRDRFGYSARLDYYGTDDLLTICERSARVLGIAMEPGGSTEIARRSRGTPRIANRLLRRVRDYAEVKADGRIDETVARAALELFDVDELGLDKLDIAVLRAVIEKFGGGPVGITSLAAALSEETDTIEDVSEPYLLQIGFLQRTPRGRLATERAFTHLGVSREPGNPTLL
jgi:holliday junction DNA helicase RuvB